MILTDTGPLVALINSNDPNHAVCLAASKRLRPGPLVTTWPCFTEAMYLIFRGGGYPAQATLWALYTSGRLALHHPLAEEVARMVALMEKYRDTPMDLADASVIAATESLALRRVFTLDSHFHLYRLANGTALEVIP